MKNWIKFQMACYVLCVIICLESLIRVGYSIYPAVLIPIEFLLLFLSIRLYRNEKA